MCFYLCFTMCAFLQFLPVFVCADFVLTPYLTMSDLLVNKSEPVFERAGT